MYTKRDRDQIMIENFVLPFGGKLIANNRWVKSAELMPWDMIEDIYSSSFKNENAEGRPPIPSRIAFGALHIKAMEDISDERIVEHISENAYMQYFLGLEVFSSEPLFDPSMMTWFRKRFTAEDIDRINEELFRRTHTNNEPPSSTPPGSGTGETKEENKGKLLLDATVAPADIRYPTDLSLLNECRENLEGLTESIWSKSKRVGHKMPYNRNIARKKYLSVAKQRKPRKRTIEKAIREQLEYVEKGIESLGKLLLETGTDLLTEQQLERLQTICEVSRQQREHYKNPGVSIPNRIVNLRQPHVRPIVRGKARTQTEFGQKIAVSVVDGYTFIEFQSWNNFAEGTTLKESVERYRQRHGFYPEAVLADKIYRNRENINYCKERGIRLSGPRLGRPKIADIELERVQAHKDNCDRNVVEGRFGTGKRRYGLNLIMSRLPESSKTEAAMAVLAMNIAHLIRVLLRLFRWRIFCFEKHEFLLVEVKS